jgi:molybdopterin-biosynthesis enzyme MoeA-like protein
MNFYSVIIGTELLNARRIDKHFDFLNKELNKRGLTHFANFVIKDDEQLMENTFKTVLADKNSVMFCFGGLGSTPDDLTRPVVAKVFTCKELQLHEEAKKRIVRQFGQEAYPHRINMAMLPQNAKLLDNVVNNVPGFYLQNRFFFTPGFPSMSWPMIVWALDTFFKPEQQPHSYTFWVDASENDLIEIMQQCPQQVELSSLPRFIEEKRKVQMYLASLDKDSLEKYYQKFIDFLHLKHLKFENNENSF